MKRIFFLIVAIYPLFSFSQKQRPKLVLGIVVDQMRYDYLVRFWDRFEDGGFRKLVDQGFNCKNANYNYMPTYTGPGHASIYTGTTPENHGIISNDWYDKITGKYVYCVRDTMYNTVGTTTVNGRMSPFHLLSTTITDQLKLATNFKGKVIGASIKDRGAILPAGHRADAAFWFDGGKEGKWISSSYYMNELPDWLKKLNQKNLAKKYLSKPWNTLYPIETYTESINDDNAYEGVFKMEENPTFPHNLPDLVDSNENYSLIKATPFGNTILKDLAIEIIEGEKLGQDRYTDFFTLSFSSTDYVGHQYGPMSVEIEDTYLRLDKDLAELFSYLEGKFKKEDVLIFLTADHGVANVPQFLTDNNIPAGYFSTATLDSTLKLFLKEQYQTDTLIANISNYQVFLNHQYIADNNWNVQLIENAVAEFLIAQKGIAKVVTGSALKSTEYTDRILANAQRGYNQARSGDVLFVLESGWINSENGKRTGTTHGSPYTYDTHVPLLWYGYGIKSGETERPVIIPDIAATIAALLDIQPPSACTGTPIHDLLK